MGAKPIPCSHGQYHQDKKDGFITRLTLLMMTILAGMNRMIEILFLLWIFVIEKVGDIIIDLLSTYFMSTFALHCIAWFAFSACLSQMSSVTHTGTEGHSVLIAS